MQVNNWQTLRLLTYNMQVGIRTRNYAEYFKSGWRHFIPPRHPTRHLEPVERLLRAHDIVAIQEADAGSFRTRSVNLLHYLAERAHYPHWHLHNHRSLAPVARHGMGLLSRYNIEDYECHALPGRIPGRAAVIYRLGTLKKPHSQLLTVVVTHLSLGERDRRRQLSHLHALLGNDEHVILMGDLNCETDELRRHPFLRERGFLHHREKNATHPSWKPDRVLDHIVVTPDIKIKAGGSLDFIWSDHLPVFMEVELPKTIHLEPST